MSQVVIRYVRVHEKTYVRVDDVVALIAEFAASEDTDTRERLRQLVKNLKGGQ